MSCCVTDEIIAKYVARDRSRHTPPSLDPYAANILMSGFSFFILVAG